jgi:putative flippase GtrA
MSTRRSLLRFAVFTVISAALNFGLTIGLHEWLGLPEEAAYAIGLAVVFIVNFLGLRYYAFPGRGGRVGTQFAVYAVSSAAFRGAEYLAFLLLHTVLGVHYVVAMIVIQTASFVTKFLYYGRFVFVRRAAPDDDGPGRVVCKTLK